MSEPEKSSNESEQPHAQTKKGGSLWIAVVMLLGLGLLIALNMR